MHVLTLLRQLLRPQRRRVALLLGVIVAATFVEVMLLPGLVASLFRVLAPQEGGLMAGGGLYTKVPLLSAVAERLDRFFAPTPEARLRALFVIFAATVVVALLRGVFGYSRLYLGQYVGGRVLIDLRTRLFRRLQRLSLSFYESQRVGDLMSRLTNDVALVQQLVTADMTNYVTAPLIVTAGLAVMFVINWKLTLLVIVFSPLTAYLVSRMGARIRRLTTTQQERIADLNARLHERLASIRVIQSFAREDYEVEQFEKVNESTFQALIRVARVGALAPQAILFLSTTAFVVVVAYAGTLIIRGEFRLDELAFYFTLTQRIGVYFVKFGSLHLRVQQSLAALARLGEIMEREPDIVEMPGAMPLPAVEGRIALRDVSFRYPDGEAVLSDVNLEIAPGQVCALVGPSGAGKTSLASLLLRFYDATEGRVEIDGRDVREVTLASLRSQIGLVPQETILFGGSVKENILYGRPGADDGEVVAAAKAANAHEFILDLANGYDTEVGERGAKLSGGQRQRIAIARALLKDPRILILDEATSSLDTESEALVQEALERLMKGRTTLVIAHRLSTIRDAERILVLSDGRIVEEGAHGELLARGGTYASLFRAAERGHEPRRAAGAQEEP